MNSLGISALRSPAENDQPNKVKRSDPAIGRSSGAGLNIQTPANWGRCQCKALAQKCDPNVEDDIAEAMRLYGIRATWSAKSLALHKQAVLQGAFILAKAKGGAEIAAASVDHLRRYIELLFEPASRKGRKLS